MCGPNNAVEHYAAKRGEVHRGRWTTKDDTGEPVKPTRFQNRGCKGGTYGSSKMGGKFPKVRPAA